MDERSILVTGAAGFIGSHVCERLLRDGHAVVGVDNFDPFYAEREKRRTLAEIEASAAKFGASSRWRFEARDITDAGGLGAVVRAHRVGGVIHLAAKAGVRPSIQDPAGYAHANVTGTSVVLEAARAGGCARVVVASSSSVYGNQTKTPFAEDDPVDRPISPYAATKRACELLGFTHHHLTGMPTAMLRFFTVYGPRQRPDLAIRSFMSRISRGEHIRMFGDGTTSRDYTFIDDIVSGVVSAYGRVDRFGYRVWNLGGSSPVSLSAMIESIGRVVGKRPVVEPGPAQPGDVERTWADLSRSRGELGYEPATAFEEGLARQWAWARSVGEV
ncbi:MAG: GDP-mannose 4,6-dehydratase [Phycisphaeraceae bacterium]|nr:MAG: GDP-mannose 4,6-dehydratase [Phycisphaeraceae bacterium]